VRVAAFVENATMRAACESITSKEERISCFKRAGIAVVDCNQPQSAEDIAFCRGLPTNRNTMHSTTQVDPARVLCAAHSSSQAAVEYCVVDAWRHGPQHVAQLKALLEREQKAAQEMNKYETEIAVKTALAERDGYKRIAFDDFKLDAKELAANNTNVILQGFYAKRGEVELLMPSGVSVAIGRTYGFEKGIGLLTENASRDIRKLLLRCSDQYAAPLGCPLTIVGHASMCTMVDFTESRSVPCVAVDDGW
jgi:hypothetical protein